MGEYEPYFEHCYEKMVPLCDLFNGSNSLSAIISSLLLLNH